jgi:(2Fe-2S) ferredoxin
MELMRKLKQSVRESGRKDLRVQKSGCLDFCEFGPTCVVYPDGAWYALDDEATLEAVFNHLLTGEIDEHATLRMT